MNNAYNKLQTYKYIFNVWTQTSEHWKPTTCDGWTLDMDYPIGFIALVNYNHKIEIFHESNGLDCEKR
jgi:hypothetical protein